MDSSHVGGQSPFRATASSLKKWWATKKRCPPYMASSLKKWWATKKRCPPYMATWLNEDVGNEKNHPNLKVWIPINLP
jgi:hypothetical protein